MKLKFKDQQFQTDAVNAVADLFLGQELSRSTFSITQGDQMTLQQNELGIGNALLINNSAMLANMNTVQKRNNLPITTLEAPAEGEMGRASRSFCVEMETGTGKTFVSTKMANALRIKTLIPFM